MMTITVSELANDVRKYLDEVQRGETIEVQKDGKPVAIVSPPKPSRKDYWKNLKPLPIKLEGPSLTEVLLKEREESP